MTIDRRQFLISAAATAAAGPIILGISARQARAQGPDALLTKARIPAFGAYDPYGDFSSDPSLTIEHLFLPWEDVDLSPLTVADQYALDRGRDLLITIEPWTWSPDWRLSPEQLRDRILSGGYDSNMSTIARILADMKSRTTVRWAQEMEDKSGQFTWASWNPADYIAAFKRITEITRSISPRTRMMWSPKGDEGLQLYYPGDAFVDFVGLSVFGLQKWDQDHFNRDRTYQELLTPGYNRAQQFGKPIVVAELGYVGSLDYVSKWAEDSRVHYAEFPALTAVAYFNQKEVYPWPEGYGLPDWRVRNHIIA